ncbi:hypothetical protein Y032_0046g1387 [Ancylostoma ceylanicum]|uniref:Secreted protein n=1 Tax=Ancylostoma ceylanicum TaxID=53326 RepID=A0A016UC35_9BILA|nr:hypothetical protein Y032_0046g1387 [Ancylostoma ceylanicum]
MCTYILRFFRVLYILWLLISVVPGNLMGCRNSSARKSDEINCPIQRKKQFNEKKLLRVKFTSREGLKNLKYHSVMRNLSKLQSKIGQRAS